MNKNLSYIAFAVTALLSPSAAMADAPNTPDLPQEYIELMGKADIAIADKIGTKPSNIFFRRFHQSRIILLMCLFSPISESCSTTSDATALRSIP